MDTISLRRPTGVAISKGGGFSENGGIGRRFPDYFDTEYGGGGGGDGGVEEQEEGQEAKEREERGAP